MYPQFIAVGFTLYLNLKLEKKSAYFSSVWDLGRWNYWPPIHDVPPKTGKWLLEEKKKGKKKESRQKQPLLESDFVWGLGHGEMLLAHRLCLGEACRFSAASQGTGARSADSIGATAQDCDKSETTAQQWRQNIPLQYLLSSTCQTLVSLRGAPVFSTP